jgi:hypothetical protein
MRQDPFDGGVIIGIPQRGHSKIPLRFFHQENSIIRSIRIFKENFSMKNHDVIILHSQPHFHKYLRQTFKIFIKNRITIIFTI